MSFRVVIPARLASSRLPGKVLADIAGQPLLAHVVARARESKASSVHVATDAAEVVTAMQARQIPVELTRADHPSGSDRIRELADRLEWGDDELVVNLQGDEPLLPAPLIDALAESLGEGQADWATLACPVESVAEYRDPNAVKVVLDAQRRALYFSRAPIPWDRDRSPRGELPQSGALRHIGLYAYRLGALRRYCAAPPAALERTECLEQLRALDIGMRIQVVLCPEAPPAGVDTQADLERVRNRIGQRPSA